MKATATKTGKDDRHYWIWDETCADAVKAWLSRVKNGQRLSVTIERYHERRSDQQNGYYWAVLGELSEWTGADPQDIHEEFKRRFLVEQTAGAIPHTRSTAALSTAEFAHYVEQCAQFSAEQLGWVWPEPAAIGYPALQEEKP